MSNDKGGRMPALGIKPYLGTRLKQWRKFNELRGYQLAAQIGISQGSLSDIENNKSHPSANTLALLHLHTNVNILWLILEEGEMERDV